MSGFFGQQFFGGGGGFGGQPSAPAEVDNQGLYDILGLEKSASQADIKKAYKLMARKHHPDRGGDADAFKEVNAANEVLSDPKKRETYDKYGLEGLKGMGGGEGFGDIFDFIFKRQHRGPRQAPQLKPTVKVFATSIEDAYTGKLGHIKVERKVKCEGCEGKGGSAAQRCGTCRGQGVVLKMAQLGPGMYTQTQAECSDCEGNGEIIKPENVCKVCKGAKLQQKEEEIEFKVKPGAAHKEKIVVREKGNEHSEYRTGDLVIILDVKNDTEFQRVGDDLAIARTISLIEALRGFQFNLKHLNDHEVTIKSATGDIIRHGDVRRIPNLGMPKMDQAYAYGDLVITYAVEMPQGLGEEQLAALKALLPPTLLPKSKTAKNVYTMAECDLQEVDGEGEEEEGEGQQGGQRVECSLF